MVLAKEGADQNDAIERIDRLDRHAEPGRARQAGRQRRIGHARAEIDVLAAQATHQPTHEMQFFNRGLRRADRTDCSGTVRITHRSQRMGGIVERHRPFDLVPLTVLPEHRLEQPVFGIQPFVGKAITVGEPAFIHRIVLKRQHPHHGVLLDLDNQVGAERIMGRDRLAARQFPGPGAVTEGLAGECTDRADVDHVARQLRLHATTDKAEDLGVLAAARHAELHDTRDFLAESHTPRAMNAARHFFCGNQRPD